VSADGAWQEQKRAGLTQGIEHLIQVPHGAAALDQGLDALVGGADGLGDLVDVLRLDDGLEVVLEQLGEVVCHGGQ